MQQAFYKDGLLLKYAMDDNIANMRNVLEINSEFYLNIVV